MGTSRYPGKKTKLDERERNYTGALYSTSSPKTGQYKKIGEWESSSWGLDEVNYPPLMDLPLLKHPSDWH